MKIDMEDGMQQDGATLHLLSEKGIYIEPLWLIEARQRRLSLEAQMKFEEEQDEKNPLTLKLVKSAFALGVNPFR